MKTSLFACIISAFAFTSTAGDHFSYRPKRLTYEFAVPFDSPGAPKLPAAKLTIMTQVGDEGLYPLGIGTTALASIEVELGKQRLSVPKQLLREVGPLDLNSLDFYWVGGRYYVALSRKAAAENGSERIEFIFRDGVLVDFWISRNSQRDKYPKVFEGTTPFKADPEKPAR